MRFFTETTSCQIIFLSNNFAIFVFIFKVPFLQGKGFGSILLNYAESLANNTEIEVVSIRNDLLSMYGKRGYKKISTIPAENYFLENQLTRPGVEFIVMLKSSEQRKIGI